MVNLVAAGNMGITVLVQEGIFGSLASFRLGRIAGGETGEFAGLRLL